MYTVYMARDEGVRRIMLTGKLIMLIGLTVGVLTGIATHALLVGVLVALNVVVLGALVWAAGWVVEGFMRR